jgi:fermentation-respiration switch protein FrsA (DUF1100 family)
MPNSEAFAEALSLVMQKGGWLVAPLGGMALLYLLQDKLVFNPVRTPPAIWRANKTHRVRAIALTMQDGNQLRGWWLRANRTTPSPAPALIYFGGRSEEVSWISKELAAISGVHSVFLNYRGYGGSQGCPSEQALLSDALMLYDWVSSQAAVDPHRVGLIGRSLGSGIAAYVASERPAAGVILITPYDSVVEIARRRFPYCATQLLLKHRFDALRYARQARAPALVLLAESDTVIPREHALLLIQAWAGEKRVFIIPATNHSDIQEHADTWQAIADFLAEAFSLKGR